MSEGKEKKNIRDVITSGPPVAGLVSPSKENLIEPKTKEKEEKNIADAFRFLSHLFSPLEFRLYWLSTLTVLSKLGTFLGF